MLEKIIEEFKERQMKIMQLHEQLEAEKEKYKADMKAQFGIADGDRLDVLQLVELVHKVRPS